MSLGELLLTLIVALFVFGPKKLPMVAYHLGKLIRYCNHYKQQAITFWQQQLNEQQLQENISKALKADSDYVSEVHASPKSFGNNSKSVN